MIFGFIFIYLDCFKGVDYWWYLFDLGFFVPRFGFFSPQNQPFCQYLAAILFSCCDLSSEYHFVSISSWVYLNTKIFGQKASFSVLVSVWCLFHLVVATICQFWGFVILFDCWCSLSVSTVWFVRLLLVWDYCLIV